MLTALPALFLASCGPPVSKEVVVTEVKKRFAEDNPPGRTGVEFLGKGVWLRAPFFEDRCLEEKDLAFNDLPSKRPKGSQGVKRISPTYMNQRYLTASTEKGFCAYIGDDPEIAIDEAVWAADRWKIRYTVSMGKSTPWFECFTEDARRGTLEIPVKDGKLVLEQSLALHDDACPHPLPGGEERRPKQRPTVKAPKAPTRPEVLDLFSRFDQALYEQEFEKALGFLSCFNLFEESKYGTCSAGEIVNLGPLPRAGRTRPQDGPPWLEYIADTVDELGAITPDRADPTMAHVHFRSRRTGKDRTVGVQWVGGQWRILGVVNQKAESITTLRVVYDLDRPERRAIFERRMKGEPIDEFGHLYNPYLKPEEVGQ
jgi:hypothetical protein